MKPQNNSETNIRLSLFYEMTPCRFVDRQQRSGETHIERFDMMCRCSKDSQVAKSVEWRGLICHSHCGDTSKAHRLKQTQALCSPAEVRTDCTDWTDCTGLLGATPVCGSKLQSTVALTAGSLAVRTGVGFRCFIQLSIRVLVLYSPVVTVCTASLTFRNSTFCPHSVFICFVWIWDKQRLFPYTTLTDWFV